MTVQEPYRPTAAPNVPATQLPTQHPKVNTKCYEYPVQQNVSSANTILQGQMSTMPQSESQCLAGITHISNIAIVPVQNTVSLPHNHVTTIQGLYNQLLQNTIRKEIQPDNFDGGGKIEWSDYVVHFKQCAAWNQWSDSQKAQMLSIHLPGEAQKLLSSLTIAQLTDYSKLKSILSDRYDPEEKEVTYRCQFRHYRREKGVSVSDYGYNLNKLAQKAYPNLMLTQLEVHVIDQFINGLGHHELQRHVQFRHPNTLHEAIGLATEYEALEGSMKPANDTITVAPIATSLRAE